MTIKIKPFTTKQNLVAEALLKKTGQSDALAEVPGAADCARRMLKSGDLETFGKDSLLRLSEQGIRRLLETCDYTEQDFETCDNVLKKYIAANRDFLAQSDAEHEEIEDGTEETEVEEPTGLSFAQAGTIADRAFGTKYFPAFVQQSGDRFEVGWSCPRTGHKKVLGTGADFEEALTNAAKVTGFPLDLTTEKTNVPRTGTGRSRSKVLGHSGCGLLLWIGGNTDAKPEEIPGLFESLGGSSPAMSSIKSQLSTGRRMAEGLEIGARNAGKVAEVTTAQAKQIKAALKSLRAA